MLIVNSVSKSYGAISALSRVSFSLSHGDVLGLVGLNGAGKSTLIKGLAGVFPFSSGEVRCGDSSLAGDPLGYRMVVGYQPERPCLPEALTVLEYVSFIRSICCHSSSGDRTDKLLHDLDLFPLRYSLCTELSKGEQQRVGFLAAVIHQPKLLLLDEPMSGLDPKQLLAFRRFVSAESDQRITILSTHLLSEIRAVCNKLLVIDRGQVKMFEEDLSHKDLAHLERYFVQAVPEGDEEYSGVASVG